MVEGKERKGKGKGGEIRKGEQKGRKIGKQGEERRRWMGKDHI